MKPFHFPDPRIDEPNERVIDDATAVLSLFQRSMKLAQTHQHDAEAHHLVQALSHAERLVRTLRDIVNTDDPLGMFYITHRMAHELWDLAVVQHVEDGCDHPDPDGHCRLVGSAPPPHADITIARLIGRFEGLNGRTFASALIWGTFQRQLDEEADLEVVQSPTVMKNVAYDLAAFIVREAAYEHLTYEEGEREEQDLELAAAEFVIPKLHVSEYTQFVLFAASMCAELAARTQPDSTPSN